MNPLAKTEHRPWPLPKGPWLMEQVWRELLFMHWNVPAVMIRPLVPDCLELDTFRGDAWISVTPFHMSVRFRGMPLLPFMRKIPEMNCRTYVAREGKPGIFFFSLDCASRAAVWGARTFYHLPYFSADMHVEKCGDLVSYSSQRGDASWRGEYGPTAPVQEAALGSRDHWLTERYCLYTVWRNKAYRGEIHHMRWPLQDAGVKIANNTLVKTVNPGIGGDPAAVSFSRELDVLIWPLRRVKSK